MQMKATIFATIIGTVSAQGVQTLWGQCGGVSFSGPSSCVPTASCLVLNPYYYQCVPASLSPPGPTTSCQLSTYSQTALECGSTRTYYVSVCSGSPTSSIPKTTARCPTTTCSPSTYTQVQTVCPLLTKTYYGTVCSGSPTTNIPMTTFTCPSPPCTQFTTYTRFENDCNTSTRTYFIPECVGTPTPILSIYSCSGTIIDIPNPTTTSCKLRGYTQVQRICNTTTRTIFGSICEQSPTPRILTVFCDTTTTTPCELITYSQTYASCFGSFGTVYGSVCSGSPQTSLPRPTIRCTTTAAPIKARNIRVNKFIKRVDTVVKAQEYGRRGRAEI